MDIMFSGSVCLGCLRSHCAVLTAHRCLSSDIAIPCRARCSNGATPAGAAPAQHDGAHPDPSPSLQPARPPPGDAELADALRRVRLGALLSRSGGAGQNGAAGAGGSQNGRAGGHGLDAVADWASMLSLGEQQRLAFARCACMASDV